MSKPSATGLQRLINATGYSIQGLKAAWRHEAAFRQEMVLLLILTPVAFLIGESLTEVALLLTTLFLVPLTELANSAIEAVVDRIGSEHHPLSGRAKDIGSAMVFVALVLNTLVWLLVLCQRLTS
ncbi:MAG: diacylglycerol kinase [Desulfuromonadaceae bacterium]|nr:diacylglycerol kinase [Desulfuromonadaceae bacterium]